MAGPSLAAWNSAMSRSAKPGASPCELVRRANWKEALYITAVLRPKPSRTAQRCLSNSAGVQLSALLITGITGSSLATSLAALMCLAGSPCAGSSSRQASGRRSGSRCRAACVRGPDPAHSAASGQRLSRPPLQPAHLPPAHPAPPSLCTAATAAVSTVSSCRGLF